MTSSDYNILFSL